MVATGGAMRDFINEVQGLSLPELRQRWAEAWALLPPPKISRTMLEKSLVFKLREQSGRGLTSDQQARLDKLVRAYKRAPGPMKEITIKPGTRLVRTWKGVRHSVMVKNDGFEYQGRIFTSLSEVAATITGTRWNGWVFFGLKKSPQKQEVA
jgi:hypothetical protein